MAFEINPSKSVETSFSSWLNKDFNFFNKRLKDKQKKALFSEFALLLNSGVDVKMALEIIIEEKKNKHIKELLENIHQDLVQGASLSVAFENTKLFSPYEIFNIKVGEESGMLKQTLREIEDYFKQKIELRRQLTKVFSYPVLVAGITTTILFILLKYIVPVFIDIFKSFDVELPSLTKMVIQASEFVGAYSWIFLLIIISTIITYTQVREKNWFKKGTSTLLIKLPLFGPLIQKVYLARFSRAISLLNSSGTPIIISLGLISKMITFYPIQIACLEIQEDIKQGNPLYLSMKKHAIFFPKMISLIRVGEEVNQLDKMFNKVAEQYSTEVEHQSSIIGTILEPLMILFISIFVGIILISMYLPLFNLSKIAA